MQTSRERTNERKRQATADAVRKLEAQGVEPDLIAACFGVTRSTVLRWRRGGAMCLNGQRATMLGGREALRQVVQDKLLRVERERAGVLAEEAHARAKLAKARALNLRPAAEYDGKAYWQKRGGEPCNPDDPEKLFCTDGAFDPERHAARAAKMAKRTEKLRRLLTKLEG